jgi:hypothetical protein
LRRALLVLGAVSLLGAAAACCVRPFWHNWFAGEPPDSLFGPLDTAGAANDLLFALVTTAGSSGLGWWLLAPSRRGRGWVQSAALVLVAIDLAAANGWTVVGAPAGYWRDKPLLAELLDDEEVRSGDGQPYRVFRRGIWMPEAFARSSSAGRLGEAVRWDHDTLWPKYNLSAGISLAEVNGTMTLDDYRVFLRETRRRREGAAPDPGSLGAVNTKYLILRGDETFPGAEPLGRDRIRSARIDDVSLWKNPEVLPRAWIVHQVETLPAIDGRDPDQIRERTEEIFWPRGSRRNLRVEAVVERGQERENGSRDASGAPWGLSNIASFDSEAASSDLSQERCRVVHYDSLRVEIAAELSEPGLVVLADQFYPGWQLEVRTAGEASRRVPILRTNRVMRGAWLPAGRHRLVYRYRPSGFFWGLIVSLSGWIGLGAVGGWPVVRRRMRPHRQEIPALR